MISEVSGQSFGLRIKNFTFDDANCKYTCACGLHQYTHSLDVEAFNYTCKYSIHIPVWALQFIEKLMYHTNTNLKVVLPQGYHQQSVISLMWSSIKEMLSNLICSSLGIDGPSTEALDQFCNSLRRSFDLVL